MRQVVLAAAAAATLVGLSNSAQAYRDAQDPASSPEARRLALSSLNRI